MTVMRAYTVDECGTDGYPVAWHEAIKHQVRDEAGHRCVRCGHPYTPGCGTWGTESVVESLVWRAKVEGGEWEPRPEAIQNTRRGALWSPCDESCTHRGPYRIRYRSGETALIDTDGCAPAASALVDETIVAGVDAAWRVLTVHHLDGDKPNCRWWNLAALCQRCHLQIQGKVQMARVYPWAHSDWFKPYAAGWYAFTYLGEELTRSETEARLDELLALELAA